MQAVTEASIAANVANILPLVESGVTSLAILAGGLWAYFKYMKGRTFKERITSELSCAVEEVGGIRILVASLHLKNVGLSKVNINQRGTALSLFSGPQDQIGPQGTMSVTHVAREIQWTWVATVSILEDHAWIEPNEDLRETHVFTLPEDFSSVSKVEAKIRSHSHTWSVKTVAITHQPKRQTNVAAAG